MNRHGAKDAKKKTRPWRLGGSTLCGAVRGKYRTTTPTREAPSTAMLATA
ncbi:hypothetical protein [Sorangium sp. So ce1335]